MEEELLRLSNERLEELNNFIDMNLRNRKRDSDYRLLYNLSGMMSQGIKIGDRYIEQNDKQVSMEKTKEIVLSFYKELDSELFEKVNNIISGNSSFEFRMYKYDENEDFSKLGEDGFPIHRKGGSVDSHDGKSVMYVPCRGNIDDVYLLAHELSHTFDFIDGDSWTRNLMGEVTPYCIEAMLGKYLVEKEIITEKEAAEREKEGLVSRFDDGVETFAKLELMRIKERQKDIKQEDISDVQKRFNLKNGQLDFIIGRMMRGEANVDFRARYMIAQLVYPHYMEEYEKNSQEAIIKLKEYFNQVKDNNFEGCLRTLGIEPTMESVPLLIDKNNKRIENLEKTRHHEKDGFEDID